MPLPTIIETRLLFNEDSEQKFNNLPKLFNLEDEKINKFLKVVQQESDADREIARNNEIERVHKAFEENERLPKASENSNKSKFNIGDLLTTGGSKLFQNDITTGSREAVQKIVNPDARKVEDNRKWFEPGAFKDGYQFGDITKTITGTGADIQQDIANGILGIGEGVVDTGAYLLGLKSKWEADFIKSLDKSKLTEEQKQELLKRYIANQQVDSQMKDFIQRDLVNESGFGNRVANSNLLGFGNMIANGKLDINSNEFENNSVLGDKSDALVQSGGQLAGQIGLSAVGVPWWVTSGVTSFAGGTEEAYANGATNEQAGVYGLINAGGEILSEKISGGISFGGKTLDEGLKKALTNNISDRTLKALAKFGFDATGEGFEEIFSEVVSNLGKKLTYENDKTWQEVMASPEAMDRYIESFIGGFALGGGANTIRLANSVKNNVDYDTGLPTQETTQEELPVVNQENSYTNKLKDQAIKEIENSKVSTEEKQAMLEAVNNLEELTQADMEAIRQTINTANEVENTLPTEGNYRYDQERKQKYMKYKNDTQSYNSKVVEEVLDITPTNRNGRRTVKQWTQVANEIGQRIANLSNEEIERIAYKSWFDVQPQKSITQYDNVSKKNVGFSRLDSDVWINNIYDGVNKARQNGINYEVKQEQITPKVENINIVLQTKNKQQEVQPKNMQIDLNLM